jgi:protein-S-isoprenylcysteine O-methyltransferase Ste14
VFTVLVPGTVTVVVPYLLLRPDGTGSPGSLGVFRYAGFIPIVLGGLTYFWCAWDFVVAGRGTPAPLDPPKELVVRGPYRYVRNPMYVGVASILLGESILFESSAILVYTAVVGCCFSLFVVFYEEPTLKRQFGSSYDRYLKAVPRWFPAIRRFR